MMLRRSSRVFVPNQRNENPTQYGTPFYVQNDPVWLKIQGGTTRKSVGGLSHWYSGQAMRFLWKHGTLEGFKPTGTFSLNARSGKAAFGSVQEQGPHYAFQTPSWLARVKSSAWSSKFQAEYQATARTHERERIIEWKTAWSAYNEARLERQRILIKINPEYRRVILEQARGVAATAFDHEFDLPPWHVLRTFTKTELQQLQDAGDKVIPVTHAELRKFRVWSYGFRRLTHERKFFFADDQVPQEYGRTALHALHTIHPESRTPVGYEPSERFIKDLERGPDGRAVLPDTPAIKFGRRWYGVPAY